MNLPDRPVRGSGDDYGFGYAVQISDESALIDNNKIKCVPPVDR